ncbi:MAG: hypothetical protein CMJ18_25590 [Phycisphaeraceae bacterium]|nr:hypothetical protein [Phycisphaeraceae bacterium]
MTVSLALGAASAAAGTAPTWSGQLVAWTVHIGIIVIAIAMFLCILRLIIGPHLADRALAVDTLGVMLIGLVVLLTMQLKTLMFFDGILVLSLLGFAGTVAMAQYIGRPHRKPQTRGEVSGTTDGHG